MQSNMEATVAPERSRIEAGPTLIEIGDPRARGLPDSVLAARGGFGWWYVDALDAAGNGVVIIWSWGLPFLPGYLSGVREGRGDPARARPSLNVAIYENGKPSFYLLQTYPEEAASTDGEGNFRFGTTTIRRVEDGRLELKLDCEVPSSRHRLQGELRLEGSPIRLPASLAPSPRPHHRWTPVLGPSRLHGELRCGRQRFAFDGLAYHDRNEGERPFDQLGIRHWIWGRLVTEARTRIWYLCFSDHGPDTAWGVELQRGGEMQLHAGLRPELRGVRKGTFGTRTWDEVGLRHPDGTLFARARTRQRIDDGFFYARTVVEAASGGEEGLGMAEWIEPGRIDRPRHRPLVRMAVHASEGPNSRWLPLFSGPRRGRIGRLLGRTNA